MNKLKLIKDLRVKLMAGESSIGSWIQIPSLSVAEIMGAAGYDWIAVDMEHGSIGVSDLPSLFCGIELAGTSLPIARLIQGNEIECKRALDAGAAGVIVPSVNDALSLRGVIQHCMWPPAGTRGVGYSRANLFGKNFEAYKKESQAPIVIAMIEHIDGVNQLEEICGVPGLDAIFIGPYDLSASLGCIGNFDSEKYKNAINKIYNTCKEKSMPYGIHIVQPNEEALLLSISSGAQFIAYSIDAVFLNNAAQAPQLKALQRKI